MADAIIQPAAENDLDEIADFIAQDSFDSAIRFYRAAFADFRMLASMPGMGAKRPSRNPAYARLRTWPIKGFRNYLVCYRPIPDGIEVLRVLHGRRHLNRLFDLV